MDAGEHTERKGSDTNSAPSVVGLISKWNKLAIAGFVIAVNVIAFDGQFVGVSVNKCPLTECLKFLPLGAYSYSSSSIVFVGFVVCVLASIAHLLPYTIESSSSHSVRQSRFAEFGVMPVLSFAMARFQTSAISRTAFSEVVGENPTLLSALTLAEPKSSVFTLFGTAGFMRSDDDPSAELLTN
jgi:hypothetical protein